MTPTEKNTAPNSTATACSEKVWSFWRWLALLAAMTVPTMITLTHFVLLAGATGGANPLQQYVYVGGTIAQFSIPLLCVWRWERCEISVKRSHFRHWKLGAAFGLVVGVGAVGLYYLLLFSTDLLADAPRQLYARLQQFGVDSLWGFATFAVLLTTLHSFLEEYYWRWFVFGQMKEKLPLSPAVLLSSLAFMSHHVVLLYVYFPNQIFTAVIPFSVGVAIGGAVWAWLYQCTGSIFAPWISHMLVDAALFVAGFDMIFVRAT